MLHWWWKIGMLPVAGPYAARTISSLVVSPLIALMKDQVDALRANGIAAAFLNSSIDAAAEEATLAACYAGTLKLLYVSPGKNW